VLSAGILCSDAAAQEQRVIINGSAAEMPMQFPGMGPRQVKTGTARIRGRIVSGETGAPVRRAQVRVAGPEIMNKTALTDAEGRYEFRDLPGGRFTLSATKSGYVAMQYGQTRPFESGKPIDLTDTQMLDKADIAMPRGSVISGRVMDEFGDPVADAMVSAMRSSWANGRRRLQSSGRTGTTNDLGQFRIYGLAPGDYYVNATLRGGGGDGTDMAVAMGLLAGGGAGGPSGSNANAGYAPTYFPGVPNGAEAQRIPLVAGQESQNVDFALLPARLAKVTGTVISSDGKPVDGSMISVVPRNADGPGMMMLAGGAARSDKNGAFTLSNVAPGDYVLQTRSFQIATSGGGDMMTFTARIGGLDGAESEVGTLPISITGEDLANVVIVTSKGATATGHLTFEGAQPPASLTSIRLAAAAVEMDGPMMGGGGTGSVKADGSFEFRGLAGLRLLRVVNAPAPWTLKAVRVNGVDVTDSGIEFKGTEALAGVEVVLTSKDTQVTGTVKGAGAQPIKDYTVVLFSEDPEHWTAPNTRHVAGARPDLEGGFQIKHLPAGSYYAIAVEYLPQGEWGDPEVLERLKGKATRFTLDEGETKALDLRMQ
ncbi:MAG: carboxypeptidase-like regulatory domain-containing protein, partial [Acidobacteriota bacterium]